MTCRSVTAWLPVRANLLEWHRITRALRELDISVSVEDASGIRHGEILWGTPSRGALVGVGWKWREVAKDLVAIDNPMSISSNVVLIDEDGAELAPAKRLLQLNNTVYRLGWQIPLLCAAKTRLQRLAA